MKASDEVLCMVRGELPLNPNVKGTWRINIQLQHGNEFHNPYDVRSVTIHTSRTAMAKMPRCLVSERLRPTFEQRMADIRFISIEEEFNTRNLFVHDSINIEKSIHLKDDGSLWSAADMRTFGSSIYLEHDRQTVKTREGLQDKWATTVLIGDVDIWELLKLLHFTVDHSDHLLLYTSQFIHSLQVYEMVSKDQQIVDIAERRDLQIAALIHDLGKLLALVGNEDDANVDCMNRVIPDSLPIDGPPIGLSNMMIQWNHDEYGYQKVVQADTKLPQRVLYAIRFHSCRELTGHPNGNAHHRVGEAEIRHFSHHLLPDDYEHIPFVLKFRHYDQASKQRTAVLPSVDYEEIKSLLHSYFPHKITW